MSHPLGTLGPVGVALGLTALLVFGVPGGGRLKPLGWWTTVLIAMLAASAYTAAGTPFDIIPNLVGSGIGFAQRFFKGATMPALAMCVLIFMLWKKLTTQQVGYTALVFFYVTSGAGGWWSYVPQAIENARVGLQ